MRALLRHFANTPTTLTPPTHFPSNSSSPACPSVHFASSPNTPHLLQSGGRSTTPTLPHFPLPRPPQHPLFPPPPPAHPMVCIAAGPGEAGGAAASARAHGAWLLAVVGCCHGGDVAQGDHVTHILGSPVGKGRERGCWVPSQHTWVHCPGATSHSPQPVQLQGADVVLILTGEAQLRAVALMHQVPELAGTQCLGRQRGQAGHSVGLPGATSSHGVHQGAAARDPCTLPPRADTPGSTEITTVLSTLTANGRNAHFPGVHVAQDRQAQRVESHRCQRQLWALFPTCQTVTKTAAACTGLKASCPSPVQAGRSLSLAAQL